MTSVKKIRGLPTNCCVAEQFFYKTDTFVFENISMICPSLRRELIRNGI